MSGTALVMAGGTGGHIFPGLAVAEALRESGWQVHWLGASGSEGKASMESQLVPAHGFAIDLIDFSGVRGKGRMALVRLPFRLVRAGWQSLAVLRKVKPDVVLGLGGYVTVPGGIVAALLRLPLILHEQNSVAGLANKILAKVAQKVYSAFPDAFGAKGKSNAIKAANSQRIRFIGNPLRKEFLGRPDPAIRYGARRGPLRVLVLGGSLGAQALNEVVPEALSRMERATRPMVLHQSGQTQFEALNANYAVAGVQAELTPFVKDTASALADADLVICRAGASTVTEIAAIGVAAVFVPFPSAVDDHQTSNAKFLTDQGGGWLVTQKDLTPDRLARMLSKADRPTLMAAAVAARKMEKTGATQMIVQACEAMVRGQKPDIESARKPWEKKR